MKLRTLICALFMVSTAQAQAAQAPIAQLRQAWVTNLEARNLDASLALYCGNATFINPDGTHTATPDELHKLYSSVFATYAANIKLLSRRTMQSGDLAFDSGSYTETLTPLKASAGEGVLHVSGDYLTLYRHDTDGRWCILEQVWTQAHP